MKRILVAEDDLIIQSLINEFLADEGYDVVVTGDGASAVAMARVRPPNLILLDLMLPVMDGMTATRALKADLETRAIPVIAISAGTNLRVHAERLPADGVVAKPFDLDTLAAVVAVEDHHHRSVDARGGGAHLLDDLRVRRTALQEGDPRPPWGRTIGLLGVVPGADLGGRRRHPDAASPTRRNLRSAGSGSSMPASRS